MINLSSEGLSAFCTQLALSIVLLMFTTVALAAQYRYLTGNPCEAQRMLINDILTQRVDSRFVSLHAQQILPSLAHDLAAMPREFDLIPTLVVEYPNGSRFAFRTHYENANIDWDVTVSRAPEIIQNIVALGAPTSGGAPAILPPPGANGTVQPSRDLSCPVARTEIASEENIHESCLKWPAMCAKGKK
jgi:hypothetical protein